MTTAVRFDAFVEAALYGPGGFYAGTRGAGRHGDFLTAVEVGPLFGAVTAAALDRWWDDLGRPDPYVVVEGGAGRGQWCRTVRMAAPRCGEAMRWTAVEVSAGLREEARSVADVVVGVLPDVEAHVVLANELLDNLPPRIVERRVHDWYEMHVRDGRPEWLPCDDDVPFDARPPDRVPWAETASSWIDAARARLAPGGRLVCLDYGSTTAELATRPWTEWVRTYVGHRRGGHPLIGPGTQDITCEVPFDQLPGDPLLVTQAQWLAEHGLDDLVDEGRRIWHERAHLGDLTAAAARSRVSEAAALTDPAGMGAFTVATWLR